MIWNKLQMVSVRKERKEQKGRQHIYILWNINHRSWLSRCWNYKHLILALKLTEDDFDFHWACAVGRKLPGEKAGLYIYL